MTEKSDVVPKILREKFPHLSAKYVESSKDIEKILECLPHAKHGLPVLLQICTQDLRSIETEIKEKQWGDYTSSGEVEQLKFAIQELKSRIVEKATSLNVDLRDSAQSLDQENINSVNVDNQTSMYQHGILSKSNFQNPPEVSDDNTSYALTEIKPVPTVLIEKFGFLCYKHKFIINEGKDVLMRLPNSKDELTTMLELCTRDLTNLEKEKNQGQWLDYTESKELGEMKHSLLALQFILREELRKQFDPAKQN